eukprot:g5444.t1
MASLAAEDLSKLQIDGEKAGGRMTAEEIAATVRAENVTGDPNDVMEPDTAVIGVVLCPKKKVSQLPKTTEERDIPTLLDKYRTELAALKAECKDVLPDGSAGPIAVPPKSSFDIAYDDIFLLRYLLSRRGNVRQAAASVRKCIAWRKQADIREQVLKPVAEGWWHDSDVKKRLDRHLVFCPFSCLVDGGALIYIRDGIGTGNLVFESVSKEEFMQYGMIAREYCFRWIDRETRRLNRIVKSMYLMDMKKMSLSNMPDSRLRESYSAIAHVSNFAYPQLVSKYIVVNAPYFISWLMGLFKPIVPTSMYEKIELHSGAFGPSEFAKEWLHERYIPEYIGGVYPDARLPAQLTGELVVHGEQDGMVTINVPSRDKRDLEISVPKAKAVLKYEFSPINKGIELIAKFYPGQSAMTRLDNGGKPVDGEVLLQQPLRIQQTNGLYRGEWKIDQTGIVVVTLNNSYSIFTSKTVKYNLDLKVL